MLPILFLTSFGALVGWITAILRAPANSGKLQLIGVIAGAIGGIISGRLYLAASHATAANYDTQINALLFAICGAIIFAAITLSLHEHSQ